jgi:acyl carrier protein
MNQEQAVAQIQKTMVEMFDLDPDAVVVGARLVEDLGLDSIDAIDMAARMHEMTGVRVEDTELKTLRTVGDVANLLGTLAARG